MATNIVMPRAGVGGIRVDGPLGLYGANGSYSGRTQAAPTPKPIAAPVAPQSQPSSGSMAGLQAAAAPAPVWQQPPPPPEAPQHRQMQPAFGGEPTAAPYAPPTGGGATAAASPSILALGNAAKQPLDAINEDGGSPLRPALGQRSPSSIAALFAQLAKVY